VVVAVADVEGGGERRPVVHDPAVAHHDRAVHERCHRAELVRHQHHGGPAGHQRAQGPGEQLLVVQVDARRRLVEHEHLRLPGQRAGDQHPLLLPTGEGAAPVVRTFAEPDGVEGVADRSAVGLVQRAEEPSSCQPAGGHDLPHRGRDARGRAGPLRHEADALPFREPAEGGAEERDLAAGDRDQPHHRPDQGGLARAVGAEQRHHLAGADRQVDAAQDRAAAERHRSVGHLDDGRGRGHRQPFAACRPWRFHRMRER
jgi:hypothetical protein